MMRAVPAAEFGRFGLAGELGRPDTAQRARAGIVDERGQPIAGV